MKPFLVLLAATFGLTAPLSAQTATNSPKLAHPAAALTRRARLNALIERAKKGEIALEFITDYTPTGSHIPQVLVYYKGHVYTANDFGAGSNYSGQALNASGALDVGSALSSLDPAITKY